MYLRIPWTIETIQLTKKRAQLNLFDADGQSMCIITGIDADERNEIADFILARVNGTDIIPVREK